jgi:Zn-dependent protease with chaperone function
MFGNFIYFIAVLLIYATYQPSEEAYFSPLESLSLFLLLTALFGAYTRMVFAKIERRLPFEGFALSDHRFNTAMRRHSILAIVVFAVDIYGLGLTAFFVGVPPFSVVPTLEAIVFLGVFVFYMALVWGFSHGVYQRLYARGISRRTYVLSNISFTIPMLLPWLVLSIVSDVVYALPFDLPRRLLSTTGGEALYFLFFLVLVALIGPAMIQKFWGCSPLEAGFFRNRIDHLCRRAGIEYANILYWPIFGGRMITAGVMGLVRRFRYILVTQALLRSLDPQEIDAVIAHEIGHVKKKHLLFYLFFFAGYMLVSYATFDLIVYAVLFIEPVYQSLGELGLNQTTVTSVLFGLMFIVIFLLYFRYIFGYFMRNFERQADAYVFSLFDSAGPLMSTLEKIAMFSGQAADKPNWHHFSIQERIDFLGKCEKDRRCIGRHDRRIRKSIGLYLVGIACIGVIGYQVGYGEPGRRLSAHFFERVIAGRIDENPNDPGLYSLLGDFYYSRKNYSGTIDAYETALTLSPGSTQVLNNLAWLYATCEDERLRDPPRALVLAEQAASLDPAVHILDTLAESYYVNGRFEEAIAAEMRALELATENRAHYLGQLEKYRRAGGQ